MAIKDSVLNLIIRAKNETGGAFDKLSKSLKKTDVNAKSVNNSFAKLAGTVKGLGALRLVKALGALYILRSGLRFTQESIRLAGIQEQAEARLATVMGNVNNATQEEINSLKDFASELQKTTTFGNELIISAEAMLGTFKLNSDQIMQLTPRILDMGAAMEKADGNTVDLESITIAVGKAFTSGIGSLTRYGVAMEDSEMKAFGLASQEEKVRILTEVLDNNFKGIAEGSARTFSGSIRQLKNGFGDFQENIGKAAMVLTKDLVYAFGVNIQAMNESEAQTNSLLIAVNKLKIGWYSLGTGILITWEKIGIASAKAGKLLLGGAEYYNKQIEISEKKIKQYEDTLASLVAETDEMTDKLKEGTFSWEEYFGNIPKFKEMNRGMGNLSDATEDQKKELDKLITAYDKFKNKVEDIRQQIRNESAEFIKAQMAKSQSFKERLADMIADHKEKWQKANREREDIERKGIKDREDLIRVSELRAEAEKEFKIIQPYLNRPELQRLAERSDVERLIESHRQSQAESTVQQAKKIEGLVKESQALSINFDFSNATITDKDLMIKIKDMINQSFNIAKFAN